MQLFVNITYGIAIGIGLYFIGVPKRGPVGRAQLLSCASFPTSARGLRPFFRLCSRSRSRPAGRCRC
jgi:hypothetical protein